MRTTPTLAGLNAFVAVMRHGSVSEAARQLNTSQPALSRLIAACEADLGTSLFHRTRKRLVPTIIAEQFVVEAERFLSAHSDLSRFASGLEQDYGPTLRIVAAPRLAYGIVGSVMRRMIGEAPKLQFSIDARERAKIERWIVNSRYDVGLASLPVSYEGVDIVPFAEARAVVLMRRDSPLAKRDHVTIRDIADCNIILTGHGSLVRDRTISAWAEAGRSLSRQIEVGTSPLAARAVAAGFGVFVIDDFVSIDLDPALCAVPLLPGFTQRIGFLLPRGNESDAPVATFMRHAREIVVEAGATLL